MPCLVAIIALCFPRVAIVLLWLFTDYIGQAFHSQKSPMDMVWPILGLVFMPFTLLAYVFAIDYNGSVDGMYLVLVIVAALVDLGVLGGGERARRQRVIVVRK